MCLCIRACRCATVVAEGLSCHPLVIHGNNVLVEVVCVNPAGTCEESAGECVVLFADRYVRLVGAPVRFKLLRSVRMGTGRCSCWDFKLAWSGLLFDTV